MPRPSRIHLVIVALLGAACSEPAGAGALEELALPTSAEPPLYLVVQMHIEPQQHRCFSPLPPEQSEQASVAQCQETALRDAGQLDAILAAFERGGQPVSLDFGLGMAESNLLAGLDGGDPGSLAETFSRWQGRHEPGLHCHFPASGSFRGRFSASYRRWYREHRDASASFAEDDKQSGLTEAEIESGIRKRVELVNGLLPSGAAIRSASCHDASAAMGILGRTGMVNLRAKHPSMHAENTRLGPARAFAGGDLQSYEGGILDYDVEGQQINFGSGLLSARVNPWSGFSVEESVASLKQSLARRDRNRINVNVLATHTYEFTAGYLSGKPTPESMSTLSQTQLELVDGLYRALAPFVARGELQLLSRGETLDRFLEWEAKGKIAYPQNASFEVKEDRHQVVCSARKECEQILEHTDWAVLEEDGRLAELGGRIEELTDGRHAFRFASREGRPLTITPGNARSPAAIEKVREEAGDYTAAGMGISEDNPQVARLRPGTRYSVQASFLPAGGEGLTLAVKWYVDRASARAGRETATCSGHARPGGTGWIRYGLTCEAPEGASVMRLFFTASGGLLDEVTVQEAR